jgi:fluoroquinolone resistance protein
VGFNGSYKLINMDYNQDKTFTNQLWSGKHTRDDVYENCIFESCDFSEGIFSFCKFIDCVFTNCNMSLVKLTASLVNNVTFINCLE